MKKTKYKGRLFLLYILSFLSSVLPLGICLFLKREEYFKTVGESVKLALGGTILLLFVIIKVLGKLRIPGRSALFGIVFVLSYLLESVLRDLTLLSGLALLGECIDQMLFQGSIRRTKELMLIEKSADVTSEKIEEVLKKYVGGRV